MRALARRPPPPPPIERQESALVARQESDSQGRALGAEAKSRSLPWWRGKSPPFDRDRNLYAGASSESRSQEV